MAKVVPILIAFACSARLLVAQDDPAAIAAEARLHGQRFERAVSAMQRVLRVWLTHADERTLLLPDRIPGPGSGLKPDDRSRLYTPHNAGADLYPYLILTAELTAPDLYRGRMMAMLRNEIRYTNAEASIPGNPSLATGELGPPSMFGAGEYAKDPKYRRYVWEPRAPDLHLPLGSFDGYADSIESALYLVAREPVPEALDWIESEMQVMLDMQRPDGHIEYWYGEGNFNRTAMLYALMQSRGVRPAHWQPGMRVGAVQRGPRLHLSLVLPSPTTIRFDYARHRRILNLDRHYVRLNEFPEWFVVDENALYRLSPSSGASATQEMVRLGSELIDGVTLGSGDWIVEPLQVSGGPPPAGLSALGRCSCGHPA